MGLFSLCLALAGVVLGMRRPADGGAACAVASGNRAEVLFWTVAAAVLLLCALGGFTPFYRLVFMLPMGDYIRCPLKFVHLVEWCVAVLAGFGIAALLDTRLARRAPGIATAALAAVALVNMANLAAIDARYCAVDPSDTIRIALSRETGTCAIGFLMDGSASIGEAEYILAGGTAFRDNAALKSALASKECAPVSFWNFNGRRFVKTARERAGFALLKTRHSATPPPQATMPNVVSAISIFATLSVCMLGAVKLKRKGTHHKERLDP